MHLRYSEVFFFANFYLFLQLNLKLHYGTRVRIQKSIKDGPLGQDG